MTHRAWGVLVASAASVVSMLVTVTAVAQMPEEYLDVLVAEAGKASRI
jgi:hypothetical protein